MSLLEHKTGGCLCISEAYPIHDYVFMSMKSSKRLCDSDTPAMAEITKSLFFLNELLTILYLQRMSFLSFHETVDIIPRNIHIQCKTYKYFLRLHGGRS
jgi:hypothetical protein